MLPIHYHYYHYYCYYYYYHYYYYYAQLDDRVLEKGRRGSSRYAA